MTGKLIGYARVSTAEQGTDRQQQDLMTAGVRRDDLYTDHGVSGARDKRPALDQCLAALHEGDTLIITTLDRLGRSAKHMLNLASELQERGINLKVLNLGGESVNTATPTGKLLFTVMSGIAEMEFDIKRERINDSIAKRRASGGNLGGRKRVVSDDVINGITADIQAGMSLKAAVDRRRVDGIKVSRGTYYRRIAEMEEATAT